MSMFDLAEKVNVQPNLRTFYVTATPYISSQTTFEVQAINQDDAIAKIRQQMKDKEIKFTVKIDLDIL